LMRGSVVACPQAIANQRLVGDFRSTVFTDHRGERGRRAGPFHGRRPLSGPRDRIRLLAHTVV
jgi:hypothetical protein